MVVVVKNPWVIVLLHCHFPLVPIFQITMFFRHFLLVVPAHENSFWKNFKATGTFPADGTNGYSLKYVKEFKKMGRWEYQHFTWGDQIELIRWNHNKVVTIGSNILSVEPLGNVKQRKRDKGSVNVSEPHVIKAYNKCMGGVDLVDHALSDPRPNFNGKKWY